MRIGIFSRCALILGRGGFGRQLGELLLQSGGFDEAVYLDDVSPEAAGPLANYLDPALRARCLAAFVGLGDNALRAAWLQKLAAAGYRTPAFVHPAAVVCPSAELGPGAVVMPFAFVGAGARAGAACIINTGAVVDHDAVLSDGVHAAPGSIIKAGAQVESCRKVASGQIVPSPWEQGAL